jgi:hypothetical protein
LEQRFGEGDCRSHAHDGTTRCISHHNMMQRSSGCVARRVPDDDPGIPRA